MDLQGCPPAQARVPPAPSSRTRPSAIRRNHLPTHRVLRAARLTRPHSSIPLPLSALRPHRTKTLILTTRTTFPTTGSRPQVRLPIVARAFVPTRCLLLPLALTPPLLRPAQLSPPPLLFAIHPLWFLIARRFSPWHPPRPRRLPLPCRSMVGCCNAILPGAPVHTPHSHNQTPTKRAKHWLSI